ncbi:dephospho-CoA kinase [Aestuariivirga sp.]|uniref:dephospho-CoA kinase n=1 Tax=Aestuariivirga sp. TaxID=2650926 RepID=UPI00391CDDAB
MIVAGLTGSIAMGKSETARMFAARGIPVFDSDTAVHELYAKGGEAVPAIAALVPSAVTNGSVDRHKLAARVMEQPELLERIEASVHPLVRLRQKVFLEAAEASGSPIAVLDIPLLFETGREKEVDVVIVVSAKAELQRQRALSRPGMTAEKLSFILSRQLPDAEKRSRADYVVDTSVSLADTAREVDRVIDDLKARSGG